MKKMLVTTSVVLAFLLTNGRAGISAAQTTQGPGSFGGELRGITRVKGKVVCVTCTLKDAKAANPEAPSKMYEFDNGNQKIIFQVTGIGEVAGVQDPNAVAYWQAVTGLKKRLPVRMKKVLWKELTAEKNLQKEVELTTLLRSTGVLDVGQIAFTNGQG